MSNVGNKYKVGFLVLAGFAIIVFGLLALGAFKSFRKTYDFYTIVTSSVQGLDKGAKVKFMGVAIGEVTKIKIIGGEGESSILVCMKFDPEAFSSNSSDLKNVDYTSDDFIERFTASVKEKVEKGLRCKLQYASISGNLFIEISYLDPKENPIPKTAIPGDAPGVYIPSAETATLAAVIAESQKTMANIGRIDFERMAKKTEDFLDAANALLHDKRVGKTLDQTEAITNNLKDLSASLNAEFNTESISKLAKDVQATFENVNATLSEARLAIKDANVKETSERARSLMESSEHLVKKAESMREELSQSVLKLDAALDAARLLLDLLERNPDAVLRGKSAKPVVEDK